MTTNVLVPRLGEGVEEVTVTKWLKIVGEWVNDLEPLLEVNTDKVDTEIPAPIAGLILTIAIPEGMTAHVGDLLAVIGQPGEAVESSPEQTTQQPHIKNQPSLPYANRTPNSAQHDIGFISPVVAKMSSEYDIDLQNLVGSGLGGRITKNDMLAFIQNRKIQQGNNVKPQPLGPEHNLSTGDTFIKHSLMRKSIAEHMLASKQTSPHVLTVMEVDLSRVVAHRTVNKAQFILEGINLTFTAYFMSAITAGLQAFPLVNSSWRDDGLTVHNDIHLGMATSLGDAGLIVPVIKHANLLSLSEMARAINDLSARARARKLMPDEVKGGTFTLTNHGVSGSLIAMPIINQPQCGILGVGALKKRAMVVTDSNGNDAIAILPMVYLSFVFDHRILDGASADWFLSKIKDTLENWK
ncbi:MAG: dihydrolipoamide acetyltransferase family protein [Chloroflexota bacterium]